MNFPFTEEMWNLSLLSVIIAVLLGVSAAHKTVVTTIISDDKGSHNPSDVSKDCREEIRRHDLSSCDRYLRQGPNMLRSLVPNQQTLEQCCRQMNQVDRRCRCEALEDTVRKELQQSEKGDKQHEEMLKSRAYQIASRCGFQSECRRDEEDESEECKREIQRQDFRACKEHVTMKGRREQEEAKDSGLEECCQRLHRLGERCQCDGISHVMRRAMEEARETQEEDRREMIRRAGELRQQCRLSVPCDIRTAVLGF